MILLPTIRSRSIVFQIERLSDAEMLAFFDTRKLPDLKLELLSPREAQA